MKATFYKNGGVDFVSIEVDASTAVEQRVNSTHKIRFSSEWAAYNGAPEKPKRKYTKKKAK
tara:strand:- start:404 stop:586 length:183 start_codon:yes stop_codon:yes gene_type:complete